MQAKRVVRWGLSVLCLAMGAGLAGCSSSQERAGLESPHPLVRKAHVQHIGQLAEMQYYDELVTALTSDPDRLVRSQAAFAIGNLNQRYFSVGFGPLADALAGDRSVFVRAAAAASLSSVADSRAIPVLVAALDDDARGKVWVRQGEKVVVYKACPADAARNSLERIVGLRHTSIAETAKEQRQEIASSWQAWYTVRRDLLPSDRAIALK